MSTPPSNPSKPVSADDLAGDLVRPGDPRYGIVWINPERMSGAACFFGTRVPVQNLFDYVDTGETLEQFLDDFPGVLRSQAQAVLDMRDGRSTPLDRAA